MSYFSRLAWPLLFIIGTVSAQTLAPAHKTTATPLPPVKEVGAVVAKVNGTPVYERSLNVEMQRIFPYYSIHGSAVPDKYKKEIRQKAMDKLVREELSYQEAVRRGVQIPPAKWEKRMAEIRGDFPTQQEFQKVILSEFGSMEAFKKFVRRSMLIEQVWDKEVTTKSAVTEADIAKYYAENKAKFVRPEALEFQTISFIVKPNASPADKQQARKRAEDALPKAQAAKNYEEFGLLAEKISEDDWRVMMGDHRMVHRVALAPEYQAAANLKDGQTSTIVESAKGFHIIRVNKRFPEKQMTLAEMRKSIRESLKDQVLKQRTETFTASITKGAKVEMY